MSSSSSDCGKLVVLVAETGHIHELDCEECTLVEAVQRNLESVTRVPFNDQLLLCLGMKLELQRSLSAYKLPSNDREVFLFNKARMRSNTPPPTIEQVPIIDIHDPPFPSSNDNPHPLDEATDPALKALPSYERQFMYHFQYGDAIYSRTIAKFDICERLLREQKVQERALEIAWGNLDHFYKMILQTYMDFMKCYSQQHRSHNSLLVNFGGDIEKLRSIKLLPALQMSNRRCLLDFVKEKNLWKMVEDCNSSHRQFENKVSEFKQEFGELRHNVERLFANKASFLTKELDLTMKDHQRFINEQKSIMQALSKDVNTVKKLVDDCLSSQLSSSLRPHDAVSALGPMYDSHDSNYIPNMQACDRAISSFLDFCQDKKNEMNSFVHSYMQKIAYIQYTIKDVRYKFSVFQEALKCQNDQFDPLKVVHGIGPAYRACLAEVVRRKAAMKLYTGMAGKLAEKLATKRECEVKRREEFLKVHSRYIPRDVLASMGLYDTPNQCDINITPFDTNLLDIDLSDLDRYAPESLLGLASKREKHGTPKSSLSMSNDGSHSAEVEGSTMPLSEKYDSEELLEVSDLVEIAGTSKMEVENAKLKAELASKIALICSISPDFDHESLDDSKIDIILKNAAEKTSEALNQKDEYIKHLKTTLKMKQIQCESYERRIQELEQRLSDQYLQGPKPSFDEEISNFVISTVQSENNRPEVLGVEEAHMPHTMENVSCASSSSKSGLHSKQDKFREGLDDNMTDSSTLSPHLDSSMMDPRRDEEHLCEKDKKETLFSDGDMALTTSSMALSKSQPVGDLCDKAVQPCLDAKASIDLQELQSALAEKSNQLADAETKPQMLTEEIFKLEKEMEISRKLLDESQMNCAHLENCLHEARKEAQTHLCAADRRASEYSALRASAIKMHSLFERLRSCVSSAGVVAFADSLRALAQSLANSSNGNDDDSTGEFRECIRVLADKVSLLSRHRAELRDRYSKAEAEIELLKKEVEDKKESVNTLYVKHQLKKQANKERISFGRLEVHEIAAFVLNSAGHYEAINRNCPYYYLSAESVALFAAHLPSQPSYIVGQVVHIERQTVKSTTLDGAENVRDPVDLLISDNTGTSGSPYGLPLGCEYFVVTVAMLPDTTIHLSPTS